MRILALDTSTWVLSAALVDGERVRERHQALPRGRHSEHLPGVLLALLDEAGLALEAIDLLAVSLGPGSFTGLRTGLATVQGMAYAARRPLVGVGSLEAMAYEAVTAGEGMGPGARLVPTLDARRGQVYAGFFRWDGSALEQEGEALALEPAALAERLDPGAVLFGEGAERYQALSSRPEYAPHGPKTPPARAIAALAAGRAAPFDPEALLRLHPHYVRRSEAEENLEAGRLRIPGLAVSGPRQRSDAAQGGGEGGPTGEG
ncbi:MAG: tRNA (adenosine(37)-N6)-threonylcarbamoyltransferase complex dimerization subunit type 1 TsaB [Deltaproteobacteria bacterium]|nr:MAG: tRNA (adenosine(37)-N6)-threonylcarbamoyltransferase complex dimerization subunit type 1 TsaB [Deltaproteobacteria bacterium]